jgi:hypothetical protein
MFFQLLLKFLASLFKGSTTIPSPSSPTQPVGFLGKIISAMNKQSIPIDNKDGEVNIVYVKGVNEDGTANKDEPGGFNDQRLVFSFQGGIPRILGQWRATVDPGAHYVKHRINPGGAAQISFGYHRGAWQVGVHRGNHEALVQTGGPVTVYRDANEDFSRVGDIKATGYFGINQHWGYDLATTDVASAGCLVGQTKEGHRQFMALVKQDPRYVADHTFKFSTTVLESKDIND